MPIDYKDPRTDLVQIDPNSASEDLGFSAKSLFQGKYCLRYQKSPVLNLPSGDGTYTSNELVAKRYRLISRLMGSCLYESFFASLDEFLQPVWTGVCTSRTSRISVLPSVGAVATAMVPRSWANANHPEGFIVCRDFSGKWTLVNSEWIKDVKVSSDSAPCTLLNFISKVNVSITRHTSFLVFDENGTGYVLEHDFINDKLFVYSYDPIKDQLISLASISDLPPGAVNIHHIRNMRVVLSTGCQYHEYDLLNASRRSIPGITTGANGTDSVGGSSSFHSSIQLLPVSTQLVVPLISGNGFVFISRGSVWITTSVQNEKIISKCVIDSSHSGIHYVSATSTDNTILLLGYDINDNNSKYITMMDQTHGLFIISTKKIELNLPLSIVSVHIDPISLDTIILGRSGCINGGSIVLSIPPLFD